MGMPNICDQVDSDVVKLTANIILNRDYSTIKNKNRKHFLINIQTPRD